MFHTANCGLISKQKSVRRMKITKESKMEAIIVNQLNFLLKARQFSYGDTHLRVLDSNKFC